MHTLFGIDGSGSAAIEMALQRCGVEWRRVDAASWEAGSALAELEAVNPLRQIPTLQLPDGSVLTESAAILIHLGLAHASSGLLPAHASARAQTIRGLVFISANCYAAIGICDYPERWIASSGDSAEDEAMAERVRRGARARLHANWDIFADQFPARPFLGGDTAGALDLLAVVVSRWSGTRAHLKASRPAFFAALQRIETLPDVAPVLARQTPA